MGNGVSEQFTRINADEGARGDLLIASENALRVQISEYINERVCV
jgi:hypothetical protein